MDCLGLDDVVRDDAEGRGVRGVLRHIFQLDRRFPAGAGAPEARPSPNRYPVITATVPLKPDALRGGRGRDDFLKREEASSAPAGAPGLSAR